MRFLTRFTAGLALAASLFGAVSGFAADAVAQFAGKELNLDLSRFAFGSSPTNFPGLLPPNPIEGESAWQRLENGPPPPKTAATNILDLRFEKGRLVGLRTMLVGSWTTTNDNVRVLAAFQKLGAQRTGAHSFATETKEWRMSVEGFCSDTAPSMLQFHITAPQRRSPR